MTLVVSDANSYVEAAVTIQFSGEGNKTWASWVNEGQAYFRMTLDGRSWTAPQQLTYENAYPYLEVHARGAYAAFRTGSSWDVYNLRSGQYITSVSTPLDLWSGVVPVPEIGGVLTSSSNWMLNPMVGEDLSSLEFADVKTGEWIQGAQQGSGNVFEGTPIYAWGSGERGAFWMLTAVERNTVTERSYLGSSTVMTGYTGPSAMVSGTAYWVSGTTLHGKSLFTSDEYSLSLPDLAGTDLFLQGALERVSQVGVHLGGPALLLKFSESHVALVNFKQNLSRVDSVVPVPLATLDAGDLPLTNGEPGIQALAGKAYRLNGVNRAYMTGYFLNADHNVGGLYFSFPAGTIEATEGLNVIVDGKRYFYNGTELAFGGAVAMRSFYGSYGLDFAGNLYTKDADGSLVRVASGVSGERIIDVTSVSPDVVGVSEDDADGVTVIFIRSGSSIVRHLHGTKSTYYPARYEVIKVDMNGEGGVVRFFDRTSLDQDIIDNIAPDGYAGLLSNRKTSDGIVHLGSGVYQGSLGSLSSMKKVNIPGADGANVRLTMNDVAIGGVVDRRVVYQKNATGVVQVLAEFPAGDDMVSNGVPWMGGTSGLGVAGSRRAYWFPMSSGTGRVKSVMYARK